MSEHLEALESAKKHRDWAYGRVTECEAEELGLEGELLIARGKTMKARATAMMAEQLHRQRLKEHTEDVLRANKVFADTGAEIEARLEAETYEDVEPSPALDPAPQTEAEPASAYSQAERDWAEQRATSVLERRGIKAFDPEAEPVIPEGFLSWKPGMMRPNPESWVQVITANGSRQFGEVEAFEWFDSDHPERVVAYTTQQPYWAANAPEKPAHAQDAPPLPDATEATETAQAVAAEAAADYQEALRRSDMATDREIDKLFMSDQELAERDAREAGRAAGLLAAEAFKAATQGAGTGILAGEEVADLMRDVPRDPVISDILETVDPDMVAADLNGIETTHYIPGAATALTPGVTGYVWPVTDESAGDAFEHKIGEV